MYVDIFYMFFWILLFLMFISPQLQFRQLKAARLSLIKRMEKKYGFRVVTMIHRQEKISFLGIPIYRFIDIEDSEEVIRAIRSTPPDVPIALILHTPGGLVLAATQIAEALKRHKGKKIVIVPHYAMSGGTLISLAADEIWMDPNAVLGPLDPQLMSGKGLSLPAPSIIKAVELKGVEKVSDETLILADVAQKALRQLQEIVCDLIKDKMDEEKARELAKVLTEGRWTHDYPITASKAKELGLPVIMKVPEEVYTLLELYPQTIQARPGIEYIPYPYHPVPQRRIGEKETATL